MRLISRNTYCLLIAISVCLFLLNVLPLGGHQEKVIKKKSDDFTSFSRPVAHLVNTSLNETQKNWSQNSSTSKKDRIFCFTLTLDDFQRDRLLAESWIAECDGAAYLVTDKNSNWSFTDPEKSSNTVFVNVSTVEDKNEISWLKTKASIQYAFNNLQLFDWFLVASEDNYVQILKLRQFLKPFDPLDNHYFGYAWSGLLATGHEGGYILSSTSVSWLHEVAFSELNRSAVCSNKFSGSECVRAYLRKVDVYSGIDPTVHSAFVPAKNVNNSATKLILTWSTLIKRDVARMAAKLSENCPVKCDITSDKSQVERADAITFHMHEVDETPQLPVIRHPWQRYVFILTETQSYSIFKHGKIIMPKYTNGLMFNWSMTYLRDSDVRFDYYGQLLRHRQTEIDRIFVVQTALKKSKMVAWLVGMCFSHSARMEYVNELRNYVSIDQYGKAGHCPGHVNISYSCPKDYGNVGVWCSDLPFTTDYRFYLSFENSVCRDYITEKFFQALDELMVPIVLRKADYVDIAPEGSYIAADQFRSPKDLADYLHFLANNPEEYLKYFDYTKTKKVVWNEYHMMEQGFCRLCRMLHENRTTSPGIDMTGRWPVELDCVKEFGKQLLKSN